MLVNTTQHDQVLLNTLGKHLKVSVSSSFFSPQQNALNDFVKELLMLTVNRAIANSAERALWDRKDRGEIRISFRGTIRRALNCDATERWELDFFMWAMSGWTTMTSEMNFSSSFVCRNKK